MTLKRIAIAGEISSDNVGDRAIHDCLLYLFTHLDSTIQTVSIDISGRNIDSESSDQMRLRQYVSLFTSRHGSHIPLMLLNIASQQVKLLRGQSSQWRKTLQSAELLAIGGGQLLMDNALNFPLKISRLLQVASSLHLPYHFTACGVGSNWSWLGMKLLRSALGKAKSITLRDHLSQKRLQQCFPGLASQVTLDPAIWAASVYPVQHPLLPRNCVGLGIINRDETNLYMPPKKQFSTRAWKQLWLDLIRALVAGNRQVEIFSTGSQADYAFAGELVTHAQRLYPDWVSLAPRPRTPIELINSLGRYSIVLAARLHASILSNAIGISTIGLTWDPKVKAYYSECKRSDLCFNLLHLEPTEIAAACVTLWRQPFPEKILRGLKQRALENVHIILKQF